MNSTNAIQTVTRWDAANPDHTFERFPETAHRIRFQDCDPFGHLHNTRYLDYFINAREEHLRHCYGLDIFAERYKRRNWVVRSSMVSHYAPAFVNDMVRIRTSMLHQTRSSIQIEGVMLAPDGERILAVSRVEFRYFDVTTGRPVRHEEDLMDLFRRVSRETPYDFGDTPVSLAPAAESVQA